MCMLSSPENLLLLIMLTMQSISGSFKNGINAGNDLLLSSVLRFATELVCFVPKKKDLLNLLALWEVVAVTWFFFLTAFKIVLLKTMC